MTKEVTIQHGSPLSGQSGAAAHNAPVEFDAWLGLIGAVLLVVALSSSALRALPLTNALLYLGLGALLGPLGFGLLKLDPIADAHWLERVTEVAVIVSLFVGGLKLRLSLRDQAWRAAYRLAGPVMVLCIGLVALLAHVALGLTPAAAILLGAVLAPTDPVLATEVTVPDARDRDRMRYALSGEAGLNDGAAFPFVVLALLLVQNDGRLGPWLGSWALERLLWAVPAGLVIGYVFGLAFGRLAILVRQRYGSQASASDLLTLALVALAYAAAEWVHAWGFLAAFAAGVGLRRAEVVTANRTTNPPMALEAERGRHDPRQDPAEALMDSDLNETTDHPMVASGLVVRDVLTFGETLERLLALGAVTLVGALVSVSWDPRGLIVAAGLFLVARPAAVFLGLIGTGTSVSQRALIGWFGLRGIGTLYYLAYAVGEGVGRASANEVIPIALTVVALSIAIHGITVTPLAARYERRQRPKQASSNDG